MNDYKFEDQLFFRLLTSCVEKVGDYLVCHLLIRSLDCEHLCSAESGLEYLSEMMREQPINSKHGMASYFSRSG